MEFNYSTIILGEFESLASVGEIESVE